jgi:hypothetical protein
MVSAEAARISSEVRAALFLCARRARELRRSAVPPTRLPAHIRSHPQPGRSMLNYIWAGLIVSAFVFALGYDANDLARDTYRNGQPLPVELAFPKG